MIVKKKVGDYHVIGEYFSDMMQLEPVLRGRNRIRNMPHDWLNQPDDSTTGDKDFYGFYKMRELRESVATGIMDTAGIDMMNGMVNGMDNDGAAYTDVHDTEGEEFDADAFYCREPEFMVTREYHTGLAPRVNIIMEMGVHCGISCDQILRASAYIVRLVRTLELRGTRVELVGESGALDDYDYFITLISIKHADEAVNYPLLLTAANPMFDRGLGFAWISRSTKYMDGYGYPAEYHLNKDIRVRAYKEVYTDPGKIVVVTLKDIIDRLGKMHGKTQSEIDAEIDKWLIEDVNTQIEHANDPSDIPVRDDEDYYADDDGDDDE